jgi:hypothetical protein
MSEMASQGTVLKIDISGTDTAIPNITTFKGPGGSATVIDKTDLDSVAKEKMMGLPDEGQLQFDINYDSTNTTHAALLAARAARTLKDFTLVFSNADEATFSGYVTNFEVSGGVDALISASVTIEISGAVVWPS